MGSELYEFDAAYFERYSVVCGVDEAGRGPLAGDVYAAAVVFDRDTVIEGINDSKKLSEKKREQLFDVICQRARCYCIASASVAEIESMNILNAAMLAMKRAVEGLAIAPELAVVDGNRKPPVSCRVETVVKGDASSQSVAAASVLAKVARDRYMRKLAEEYPQYGFDIHKGYGTKLHYQRLDEFGASEVHRMSFLKKYYEKRTDGK